MYILKTIIDYRSNLKNRIAKLLIDDYFLKKYNISYIEKYDKTAAQVMLAWEINHGLVAIPKSAHEGRILENADIFFEIEEDDMKELNKLGPERRLVDGGWSPKSW